ncbi:4'-phosphopantetheinyl transferase superfamily protein [Chryseobacterium indologenes]|uniref:4'-phosphopantetheinyl transferase family protein n=1 Tax=Chryseobacterium indologenes TaxID=253 RepID=UPI001109C228|nr:4'-phosphopantetheinyl transferase superfamily protein [Chryseobacterium indologenes]TLX27504.1 4'-phosphopantetheinyl transferase superfamily protein [Chryseobacterium indologenes]
MTILYTFIDEERHQEILDQHLNLFSEDFKSKILKYRRWEDAQLSLLGRILLLDGLKTYYDITTVPEIYILSNKKPYLKGNPVHFNISHSRNMVVCAIAGFPLGIDVEFLDHTINYFDFQFQMTTGEFEEIHHSEDKTKSFFRYWTRKEAVIKAHGDGMMIPLDSFEVLQDTCTLEGKKFFTKEIPVDENYQACVASDDEKINTTSPLLVHLKM